MEVGLDFETGTPLDAETLRIEGLNGRAVSRSVGRQTESSHCRGLIGWRPVRRRRFGG